VLPRGIFPAIATSTLGAPRRRGISSLLPHYADSTVSPPGRFIPPGHRRNFYPTCRIPLPQQIPSAKDSRHDERIPRPSSGDFQLLLRPTGFELLMRLSLAATNAFISACPGGAKAVVTPTVANWVVDRHIAVHRDPPRADHESTSTAAERNDCPASANIPCPPPNWPRWKITRP